jgi:uncharacterized membrane-anchored protein
MPNALEPQHIFATIGIWISDTISTTLGELFAEYGAILIGLNDSIPCQNLKLLLSFQRLQLTSQPF